MPLLCLEDDHFLNAKIGYTTPKYSHGFGSFGSIVGFAIIVNI